MSGDKNPNFGIAQPIANAKIPTFLYPSFHHKAGAIFSIPTGRNNDCDRLFFGIISDD